MKSVRQAFEDDAGFESESDEEQLLGSEVGISPFCWPQEPDSRTSLQPLPSQMLYIWQVYIENIDPLLKILHVPTMVKVLRDSKGSSILASLASFDHSHFTPSGLGRPLLVTNPK